MTKYCAKCGRELHTLPAYITSDKWQCTNCFERGVTRCHTPLVKLNIRLMPTSFSTHDEYHIELTGRRRYE